TAPNAKGSEISSKLLYFVGSAGQADRGARLTNDSIPNKMLPDGNSKRGAGYRRRRYVYRLYRRK
ncbi:MAG: hypothetical protein ACRCZQ_06785, partial [Bacteroidales bacterium]